MPFAGIFVLQPADCGGFVGFVDGLSPDGLVYFECIGETVEDVLGENSGE